MKSLIYLMLIIFAIFFVVTKSEDEDYYTTETINEEFITTTENALLRTGPEEYGKREQLDPNLTGLENFAILYLPKNFNYSNIIDAYREVKEGITYEILANATDPKNNIIVCELRIHEKPWLITPWEGRVRILNKSNCSSIAEIREFNEINHVDQAAIDKDYQNNTIFNTNNSKTTSDAFLDNIETKNSVQKTNKENNVQIEQSLQNRNEYDTTANIKETSTPLIEVVKSSNNKAAEIIERTDNNEKGELSMSFDRNKEETSTQQVVEITSEAPIIPNNVHQVGSREKLQTNLVSLENMALVYLPRQFTYKKILDASREIVNGVIYEISILAIREDNSDIICDIKIQEKPWLLTPWGDKVRVLEKSNCSNIADVMNINDRNHIDQATLDDKYRNNTIFNPTVQHVSDDVQDQIDAMIIKPKKKKQNSVNNQRFSNNLENMQIISKVNSKDFQQSQPNRNSENEPQQLQNTEGQLLKEDKEFLNNFFNYFNVENESSSKTGDNRNIRNKRSPKKYNLKKSEHIFEKFKNKYNRNYENTFEHEKRFQIFKSNLIKINQLNKKELGTAKYGVTEFADMTTTEYKMRTGLNYNLRSKTLNNIMADIPDIELPKEFDWRTKNVISEVKDQGSCGSCWAFSIVGNIEGLHAIRTGNIEEYSEQELVDCDKIDHGCNGGLFDDAYKAIVELGGLESEVEYPYEAAENICKLNKTEIRVKIKGGLDFPKNETAMALWLTKNGPISIGINANSMMFYRGGISHPWSLLCRKGGIDHGVLLVGFGEAHFPVFNKTIPYWIIKNSWGKHWGEQGYFRLFRGDNSCGVNSMATSAILD